VSRGLWLDWQPAGAVSVAVDDLFGIDRWNKSPVISSGPHGGTTSPDNSRDASPSLIMAREDSHPGREPLAELEKPSP
jgi:hypothetical protein